MGSINAGGDAAAQRGDGGSELTPILHGEERNRSGGAILGSKKPSSVYRERGTLSLISRRGIVRPRETARSKRKYLKNPVLHMISPLRPAGLRRS